MAVHMGRTARITNIRHQALGQAFQQGVTGQVHPTYFLKSFDAVNQMRILGRWMRMLTIPNQSSVAKAFQEFDEDGRMKPSAYFDRVVDVMEELVKFTLLTRDIAPYLVDRYSERKESAEELSKRVNQKSI